MQKLDPKTLPPAVADAYAAAERWIGEKFKGRRLVPKPTVVEVDVPEEADEAGAPGKFYAIVVPPGSHDVRAKIEKAMVAVGLIARERGAVAAAESADQGRDLIVVECCLWAQGMPADTAKDPRVVARDFLKSMRDEPGSLAAAFDLVADAALEVMKAPEMRLGKL